MFLLPIRLLWVLDVDVDAAGVRDAVLDVVTSTSWLAERTSITHVAAHNVLQCVFNIIQFGVVE